MFDTLYIGAAEAESLVIKHRACVKAPKTWSLLRYYEEVITSGRQTSGAKVVDVGCGYGEYAGQFRELGVKYLGIDISPDVIAEARRRSPGNDFEVMSFRHLRLPDNSVDLLWCAESFVNTPKQAMPAVLGELRRVLVPEGQLVIVTPVEHCGSGYVELDEMRYWDDRPGSDFMLWHWVPTPASLAKLCEDAGFRSENLSLQHDQHGSYLYQTYSK